MKKILIITLVLWAKSLTVEPVSPENTADVLLVEGKKLLRTYVLDEKENLALASLSAR